MSRLRKLLRIVGLLLLVAFVAIQFVPVERSNPPIERDIGAPPEVAAILRRSCYDCHSHETRWPWYAHVAPASWLLERDVREARRKLNFSTWNRYDSNRREHKLEEVVELTASGEMPLWFYVPLHPSAKLSEADLAVLHAWAQPSETPPP
jgi:hypothetical protein